MSPPEHLPHDWFDAPLPANIEIGEGSWLYSSYAFLHCHRRRSPAVVIGRSCGIYDSCFFELGPAGQVHIGDYSTLVGVIVATNGNVRIGSYCFLAHEVVLADTPMAAPAGHGAARLAIEPADVVLGDDVWVGAGAVLIAGARIGNGAIVGAGAIVDFEVPAFAIVAGNPAVVVGHATART